MIQHIEVTQLDIDRGRRSSCRDCPVAIAIERVERHDVSVSAGGYWSMLHLWWIDIPLRIRRWIEDYDAGRSVTPTQFVVVVPDRQPQDHSQSTIG